MATPHRHPGESTPTTHIERAAEMVARGLNGIRALEQEQHRACLEAVAAAAVAHEVRNMLTPARARLELALLALNDKALVERSIRDALRGIELAWRAAEAVLGVVRGRVEIGVGASIQEAVATACTMTGAHDARRETPLGLRALLAPFVLEQILVNLISNARFSSSNSTVYVRSRALSDVWVAIEVEDRGVGMGPGVFELAVQGKGGRGGMGLLICKHLVEAVGGTIEAQSEVGKGTTIRVVLPRADAAAKAAA
jgi:signal transduction histidine kinase